MSLSDEERKALVLYKLEKAHRTLEQAKGNLPLEYWEVIANRLYYAAYYAVSALLLTYGHKVQTHQGIIQMFGLNFIKTGKISADQGRLYSKLFSLRLTGDYNDSFNLSKDDVLPLVEPTENLIMTVEQKIKEEIR